MVINKKNMQVTEKTKEVAILEKKTSALLHKAEILIVNNDESMLEAGSFLKEVKINAKIAKEEKEKATKPLNDVLKTIRGWFAPIENSCEMAIDEINEKMVSYQNGVDEKRRKAEREAQKKLEEAQKELDKGKITEKQADKIVEKIEAKLEKAPEVISKSESFHTRIDRKVKFLDPTKFSIDDLVYLSANGYLVWDEVKGRRDALAGFLTVGVEIYEQKTMI